MHNLPRDPTCPQSPRGSWERQSPWYTGTIILRIIIATVDGVGCMSSSPSLLLSRSLPLRSYSPALVRCQGGQAPPASGHLPPTLSQSPRSLCLALTVQWDEPLVCAEITCAQSISVLPLKRWVHPWVGGWRGGESLQKDSKECLQLISIPQTVLGPLTH